MTSRKIRSAYDDERYRVGIDFRDEEGNRQPAMTEQCHKKECDIGHILKKYDKTGLLTHVNNTKAEYGDFTEVGDYKESLNKIIKAQDSFMELPSEIRKKFGNDPGNYIEFVTNPNNKEEMIDLGLAIREPKKEIPKVEIVGSVPNPPSELDT